MSEQTDDKKLANAIAHICDAVELLVLGLQAETSPASAQQLRVFEKVLKELEAAVKVAGSVERGTWLDKQGD